MSGELPQKVAGLALRELPEGECVVLPPDGKAALVLNATGAVVLELCDGTRSAAAIAAIVAEAFPDAPPARVGEDVAALLRGLAEAGCLRR
jgi:hypothetical protein